MSINEKRSWKTSLVAQVVGAVAIAGTTAALKALISRWFHHDEDTFFIAAVGIAAWCFGPRCGGLVVILAAAMQVAFFALPRGALVIHDPAVLVDIAIWSLEGLVLCFVFARLEYEQRRAHGAAAAEQSERLMRQIFAAAPSPMLVLDRDSSNVLEANDAALALYGYTREQFIGSSLRDLRVVRSLNEARDTVHHKAADGSLLHLKLTAAASSLDGHPVRIVILNPMGQSRAPRRPAAVG